MSIFELLSCVELGIIFGVVAIGIYLTFRVLDFPDLTCDGSFVLGGAVAAILIKGDINPYVALVFAMLSGACAGLGTWLLHTYFKMTNLLAGILMAFMLYSINLKVMQNIPNIALIENINIFYYGNSLYILSAIALLCVAVLSFMLMTDFGLGLRSVGQNQRLAQNCGVSQTLMTMVVLIISNALIALSGALFTQHQGFADISQGVGTIIIGLAAVMIGEKLFSTRSMWLALTACIIGSIVYRVIIAFALYGEWLGLQTQDLNLITGVMVVAIMVLPQFKLKVKNARA